MYEEQLTSVDRTRYVEHRMEGLERDLILRELSLLCLRE